MEMVFVAAAGEGAVTGFSIEVLVTEHVHVVTGLALGLVHGHRRTCGHPRRRRRDTRPGSSSSCRHRTSTVTEPRRSGSMLLMVPAFDR